MSKKYFDPAICGRVRQMALKSQKIVEGSRAGLHKSRMRGMSTTFSQHRQYVHGDDLRHLDWKVFAKTDKYFIREFEAETNLECRIFLDCSESMFYQSEYASISKYDYAATLATTLSFMLLKEKDSCGLILFDDKVRTIMPPRSSHSHFLNMVETMENITPGKNSDLNAVLLKSGSQFKKKGIAIVISDFIMDVQKLAQGLSQLNFSGQDVILMLVEDPAERDFPFSGQTRFLEVEGDEKLLCDASDLRDIYLEERSAHHQGVRDIGRIFAYPLEILPTDQPLEDVLAGFLVARMGKVV
ncbi:MAG: hypothetical protein COA79_12745 [Planctomycetota bacterium]|nr:MAG: hypothetical protein COA79_12745 [Planctomycetota bacterium]